uniref:Uncharacterized protein n=1 Tax=Salix viminalis TaxID=40686 RepID=A0A6N2MCG4_SALVM
MSRRFCNQHPPHKNSSDANTVEDFLFSGIKSHGKFSETGLASKCFTMLRIETLGRSSFGGSSESIHKLVEELVDVVSLDPRFSFYNESNQSLFAQLIPSL